MEFYRIWRILAGHKWVLIWLPIIATCVGLGLTYVLPEQYESTALVLAPAALGQPTYPSGSFTPRRMTESAQSTSRSTQRASPVAR